MKFHCYSATEGSKRKTWAIGVDTRGVHTFFTEPEGSKLIYYHKPIDTDFSGSMEKANSYALKKLDEKLKKNYSSHGDGFFDVSSRLFNIK